jgi:hypothetical protein
MKSSIVAELAKANSELVIGYFRNGPLLGRHTEVANPPPFEYEFIDDSQIKKYSLVWRGYGIAEYELFEE